MRDYMHAAQAPHSKGDLSLWKPVRLLAAVAVGVALLAGTAQADMKGLIIGSGSVGANFFAFGSALQQVLTKTYPNLTFENTATSGSVENVRLLHRAEIDAAIFQISASTTGALNGTGRFDGEPPFEELRAIGTLFDFKYSVIVRADSDIRTLNDLKGKRIAIGPDPATQDTHAAPLFHANGIDYENDLNRTYASFSDIYRQLAEGRVDAALGYTSGFIPLPAIQELASGTDLRWIGWDADKLRANNITPITVPAGTLPGQTESFVSAQRGLNMLATTTRLTDDQAYELAKVLHTELSTIAELVPPLRANTVDLTTLVLSTEPFQYHAGAIKYWQEVGLMK